MNESLQSVRPEDVTAAEELAKEATSMSDVATLREMLVEQNDGNPVFNKEDGTPVEVTQVGQQEFAELGKKATEEALKQLPESSKSWQNDEK